MLEDDIPLRKDLFAFVTFILTKYVFLKLNTIGQKIWHGVFSISFIFSLVKQKIVLKLLWRRGTLIRPVSHTVLFSLTIAVLIGGGLLGSSQALGSEFEEFSQSSFLQATIEDRLVEPVTAQTKIPEGRGRDQVIKYRAEEGDTLFSIAQEFNVSVDTLTYVNDLNENDYLPVGQELTILPVSGIYYTVESGDTIESLAEEFKIDAQAIVEMNWLDKPYVLQLGQELILPNAEAPKPVTPTPTYASVQTPTQPTQTTPISGSGQFAWPTAGSLSRGYGWYYGYWHGAVDIANNSCGGTVVASDSGYVDVAGWRVGGYGITVWINHGNGYYTRYAHLSSTSVSAGSYVKKGQAIGTVGATGLAFGCHLHFVVERNGAVVNPLSVL